MAYTMNPQDWHIVCPESNETLTPVKVWKGSGGIVYGQFKKHHHRGQQCDYTDLIARAESGPPPSYHFVI